MHNAQQVSNHNFDLFIAKIQKSAEINGSLVWPMRSKAVKSSGKKTFAHFCRARAR